MASKADFGSAGRVFGASLAMCAGFSESLESRA